MEETDNQSLERRRMVDSQLRVRDITNRRVLAAMGQVPRHRFVRPVDRPLAYTDAPLPIGHRQTISQPYIVALMTQLVEPRPEDTLLEIGTGSGYQAAILATLARRVISVERIPELAAQARQVLSELGIMNVEIIEGDGRAGMQPRRPMPGSWSPPARRAFRRRCGTSWTTAGGWCCRSAPRRPDAGALDAARRRGAP